MHPVTTDRAAPPGGHYSQAMVHNGLAYVSGQLPITPAGEHITGDIEAQTRQTLANLAAILEASGSSMGRVIKATVYVTDVAHWPKVNAVYAEAFGEHRPARAVVPTRDLHHGFLVEVEAIAAVVT
ncbi:MAG: RidA family protein [Planctomycetota bacterium]